MVAGLVRLKQRAIIAPCSNGSIALMSRLAKYGGLPRDCILGADIARDYKPKPEVYLASCRALRLAPEEVRMAVCHNGDLRAARAAGLQTGFVPRTTEHGPGQTIDLEPEETWDAVGRDIGELADLLERWRGNRQRFSARTSRKIKRLERLAPDQIHASDPAREAAFAKQRRLKGWIECDLARHAVDGVLL